MPSPTAARLLGARLRRLRRQIALAPKIERETGDHADARGAEAPVPAEDFAQRSADQQREKAADVHADVVDVVGAARARISALVEIADLARQAGQEQAIADRDGRQRHVEQRLVRSS